jgi:hypothetical protein
MERFKRAGMLILILLTFYNVYPHNFPYRDDLKTDIKFWKKIFTEFDSNHYVIHDSQYLNIIYTVVSFDSTVSERTREKKVEDIKEVYKDLLLKLHAGNYQPDNLPYWERRVYDMFIVVVEEGKFRNATKRIRAQQGIQENFVSGVKRSFAYLPYLKEIFLSYNLPEELIYMPHIESSYNPRAVSHVGARGMWQFMRSTARLYMRVNRVIDERWDPLYSSKAAAKLLRKNYAVLQDWALAITAYNHGLAGMKRAKKRFDGDYLQIREGYLRRSFGFASKNFYPEFIAAVEIMDSLRTYFPFLEKESLFLYQEITLSKSINIRGFSHTTGLEIDELKKLNPSYSKYIWRGNRNIPKGYLLRLPNATEMDKVWAYFETPSSKNVKLVASQSASGTSSQHTILDKQKYTRFIGSISAVEKMKIKVEEDPQVSLNLFEITNLIASRAISKITPPVDIVQYKSTVLASQTPAEFSANEIDFENRPVTEEVINFNTNIIQIDNSSIAFAKPTVQELQEIDLSFQSSLIDNFLFRIPGRSPISSLNNTPAENASLNVTKEMMINNELFSNFEKELILPKPDVDSGILTASNFEVEENILASLTVDRNPDDEAESKTYQPMNDNNYVSNNVIGSNKFDRFLDGESGLSLANMDSGFPKPEVNPGYSRYNIPYSGSSSTFNVLSMAEIPQILNDRLSLTGDNVIIFPNETIGQIAEWLRIRTNTLRRINNLLIQEKIYTGELLRLDFSNVSAEQFHAKRLDFHVRQVVQLLRGRNEIRFVDYEINPGENVWYLAHKKYKFPVNLLLYFNDLNKLDELYPGDKIKVPIL